MQTVVFTAKSTYARFRCSHTTTSALTYLTIHPIAIKGLIGAVMGIDYEKLFEYVKNMKVGIQVLNPVYKDTQAFNLVPQKNSNKKAANFQSRIQFLRDVKYRIFICDEVKKLEEICKSLNSHNYIFTPYLGCSEHIAKLEFEGIYTNKVSNNQIVNTVIPQEYVILDYDKQVDIYMDRIPTKNSKEREYIEYRKVMFNVNSELKVMGCKIYEVGKRNVFFF